jgi:hypothetical protein
MRVGTRWTISKGGRQYVLVSFPVAVPDPRARAATGVFPGLGIIFRYDSGLLSAERSRWPWTAGPMTLRSTRFRPDSGTHMNLRDLCRSTVRKADLSGAIRSLSRVRYGANSPNAIAQHSLRRLNEGSKVDFRFIRNHLALVPLRFPGAITIMVGSHCSGPGNRLDAGRSSTRFSRQFAECELDPMRIHARRREL